MSGLLVKSTLIMRENLEELNQQGLSDTPVLLGGAALTRTYVERDLREVYEGRLFYGKDAFEGLHTMDTLMEGKRTGVLDPDFGRALGGRDLPRRAAAKTRRRRRRAGRHRLRRRHRRRRVHAAVPRLHASRRASRSTTSPATSTRPRCSATSGSSAPTRRAARPTPSSRSASAPSLRAELDSAQGRRLAGARGRVGLLPGQPRGQRPRRLDRRRPPHRAPPVHLPAPARERHLCIADFFRSVDSGDADYAAFHVVTVGDAASARERELFAADRYQEYLLTHGLSVEMTEALAELWHRRIREEWGFADEDGPTLAGLFRQQYRGSRYSWGYPACPDLEDQAKLDELLELHRIGVKLTEEFQLEPEQSTSAIIVPHPEAKYFIV